MSLRDIIRAKLGWNLGDMDLHAVYDTFLKIVSRYGYSTAREIFEEARLPVPKKYATAKVILVGDSGVGKTSLCIRFTLGTFAEKIKSTVGVAFGARALLVKDDLLIKLVIWDTAGQERFSSLRPAYYKGALGGLLVFDITDIESFLNVEKWANEARSVVKDIPLLLVGNKIDLPTRKISEKDALKAVENLKFIGYIETSAKTGKNVEKAFINLAKYIVDHCSSKLHITYF